MTGRFSRYSQPNRKIDPVSKTDLLINPPYLILYSKACCCFLVTESILVAYKIKNTKILHGCHYKNHKKEKNPINIIFNSVISSTAILWFKSIYKIMPNGV